MPGRGPVIPVTGLLVQVMLTQETWFARFERRFQKIVLRFCANFLEARSGN